MPFVLDASVALAGALPDEISPYADAALRRLRNDEGFVPAIWPVEVVSGLVMAVRRGRITEARSAEAADFLLGLPLTTVDISFDRVFGYIRSLATDYGLTAYDATYLDLAMREGLPLCTRDRALEDAAHRSGVTVLDFS